MTFKEDITKRIKTDFGEHSNQATKSLTDAIARTDYLATDRVIRCIVFLASGNIDNLNKYIEVATFDPRDVMLWAEYEKMDEDFNAKRIRDFNKTFDNCTFDVKQ